MHLRQRRPAFLPSRRTAPNTRLLLAVAALLLVVVIVRMPALRSLGHGYDLEEYRQWAAAIQQYGLDRVFDHTHADYVGYHYLLWVLGRLFGDGIAGLTIVDTKLRIVLKSPGLIGDLLSTAVVVAVAHSLAAQAGVRLPVRLSRLAGRLRLTDAGAVGLAAGVLWGLNPALIYASSYWGQNDSLVTAFALGAVWAAVSGRPAAAAAILVAGATIKPQPLIVAPVVAWAVLDRSGWSGAARAAVVGLVTLLVGHLYFVATGNLDNLTGIYRNNVVVPERLSFSAYNLWWPAARLGDLKPADIALSAGPIGLPWATLTTLLVVAVLAVTLLGLRRRRDLAGVLLAGGYLIFGFFMVGAGIHGRYALPALAFIVSAVAVAPRWGPAALAISVTCLINSLMTLPFMRLYQQGEPVWLSMLVSAANVVVLGYMTGLMLFPRRDPHPMIDGDGWTEGTTR
jgi:dolichyl-phosphate-mannose-protein mannosyltransferase